MRGRRFSVCESSIGLITRSWAKLKKASSANGLSSRHGSAPTRREISSHIDRAAKTGFSPYHQAYHDLFVSPFAHAVNSEDSVLSSWLAEPLFVPDDELSSLKNWISDNRLRPPTFSALHLFATSDHGDSRWTNFGRFWRTWRREEKTSVRSKMCSFTVVGCD